MTKENNNSKQGFTIIEVVLVLAIAGLIFLMVFVALPALQRSQRDTARRNDISRVGTSLVQWQTNHGSAINNLPNIGEKDKSVYVGIETFNCATGTEGLACEFVRDYMNSGVDGAKENSFQDPDGPHYSLLITKNLANAGDKSIAASFSDKSKLEQFGESGSYTIGGTDPYSEHVIYVVPGAMCDDNGNATASGQRHYAVLYRLEGAGVYCLDDQ